MNKFDPAKTLAEVLDSSPRGDWMTSGERLLEARRVVEQLRLRGLEIRVIGGSTCHRKPGHAGMCHAMTGGEHRWWDDHSHGMSSILWPE